MKETNEATDDSNSKQEFKNLSVTNPTEISPQQTGLLSRISGGVYNKAATVAGGVGWVAGTAMSTTYNAVTTVGGIAISPFKKSPKCKSD